MTEFLISKKIKEAHDSCKHLHPPLLITRFEQILLFSHSPVRVRTTNSFNTKWHVFYFHMLINIFFLWVPIHKCTRKCSEENLQIIFLTFLIYLRSYFHLQNSTSKVLYTWSSVYAIRTSHTHRYLLTTKKKQRGFKYRRASIKCDLKKVTK